MTEPHAIMQTVSQEQDTRGQAVMASLHDDGRSVRLDFPSGETLSLAAPIAWTNCPSALRRRQRLDGCVPLAPSDIRIVRLAPMGRYALNIAFSDGHDRGVYPWALLMHLARMPNLSDFLIPAADAAPHSRKEPQ